jgi:hypothetical protein
MTVTPWRTLPNGVDDAEPTWIRLPSGIEQTRRPLVVRCDCFEEDPDRLAFGPIYARLTARDAAAFAASIGARLPTREEVIEGIDFARAHGLVLAPVTLSYGPEMVTRDHAIEHDRRVREQLRKLAHVDVWTGLVAGIGKHWVSGAAPGMSRICGWPRADGSLIQTGTKDIHGDTHHDYATTTLLVRDPIMSEAA